MDKSQALRELLKHYLKVSRHLKSTFIFDRQGLVISSASKSLSDSNKTEIKSKIESENESENEEVLGAIAGIMDIVLARIGKEYNLGKYSCGSFETEEFRIIFAEAGAQCIFISLSDFELTLNEILPYVFLVSEKISRITEFNNVSDSDFNLEVPDLGKEGLFSPGEVSNYDNSVLKIDANSRGGMDVNLISLKPKLMRYKVIILGNSAVGKTSLVDRFATEKFNKDYRPTLGISITEQEYNIINTKDSKIQFLIWDLAGQKFFQRARKAYMGGSQAAFLVYDVTNESSFKSIPKWYEDVREDLSSIPFIIIANKIDLVNSRVISSEQGRELAHQLKCSYIETSAKTGVNVQESFQLLGIGLFFQKKNMKN